jgi:hypothetical protein
MIAFDYDGKTYVIQFERKCRPITLYTNTIELGRTSCYTSTKPYTTAMILEKLSTTPTTYKTFRTWTVGCYHRDQFVADRGRTAALRGALREDKRKLSPTQLMWNLGFRQALWTAYCNRRLQPT